MRKPSKPRFKVGDEFLGRCDHSVHTVKKIEYPPALYTDENGDTIQEDEMLKLKSAKPQRRPKDIHERMRFDLSRYEAKHRV